MAGGIRFRHGVSLLLVITIALLSADPAGAGDRFPSRRRALAREHVIERSGTTAEEYRVGSPPRNTTYDLRGLTTTAYPFDDSFPIGFGGDDPGVRTVVIGASIEGQAPTAWRWDDFDEELGDVGAALRMVGVDYVVSYDLRADNVFDGFRPRPADDDTTAATFLIAGCHMTYIRDDAIENDRTMSGVIDDCLFDGINMGLSEQQGDDYPNPRSVVRIQDSVFIFRPMPHDRAGDGRGHARMFKWSAGAGKVDMRRVVICYRETPISLGDSSFEEWPRGEFANITVVLGPDYDGDRDGRYGDRDHPGRAPRGVAVTRDWSVCNRSRSAWLDAH